MSKINEKNMDIMVKNKQTVRDLQNFYVNAELENLPTIIEEKKKEVVNKLVEFQQNHIKYRTDKWGNEIQIVNPYLISTYFFKPINPMATKTPLYSAEKLSIVWDLYMYLIEQVNLEVAPFQPTLTHFAKFAGISLKTLSSYKNSGDEDMIVLIDKIYDECFNGNVSLAQAGNLKEKVTMSRMKIENQVTETATPQVKVNLEAKIDLNEVNKRLEEIKKFNGKVIELDKKRGK